MTRNRTEPFLRLLAVEDGTPSPYAHIDVTLGGESLEIRWGLDALTYSHLKRAFQARPFDELPGTAYERYLLLSYSATLSDKPSDVTRYGVLECRQGKRIKNVEFQCSEYFITNIAWFQGVTSLDELAHLRWQENCPS